MVHVRFEGRSFAYAERELHVATRGLAGPEVPFDGRYRKKSLIFFRYGSFRNNPEHSAKSADVFDPAGNAHPDRRSAGHAVPWWLEDPFKKPVNAFLFGYVF